AIHSVVNIIQTIRGKPLAIYWRRKRFDNWGISSRHKKDLKINIKENLVRDF
ncbi:unnamed protein product, partial [marine sediment metagenome]